jgi:hypothetical protein
MRMFVGLSILAAQLVMIGVARVHPIRYYTWAPFDSQNDFSIQTIVDGRELSPAEVLQRYRKPARGHSPRSIYEVVSTIEYVETHYRKDDRATVTVVYRTNGGPEQTWQFPR